MLWATLQKPQASTLDFAIDYSSWLPTGDTIANSTWSVPSGLTGSNAAFNDTITSITLSGGTNRDLPYEVVNTVTTAGSPVRIDTRLLRIIVPTDEFLKAYVELTMYAQPTTDPVLTESELNECLLNTTRAKVWAANTLFKAGEIVIPTSDNYTGQRYIVRVKGTSGATEPTWPTSYYGRVADGSTLVLEEAGLDLGIWDVMAAARKAWEVKASKVAQRYDHGNAGSNRSASQLYEHCIKQSSRFLVPQVA